jgi:hypothetical protein
VREGEAKSAPSEDINNVPLLLCYISLGLIQNSDINSASSNIKEEKEARGVGKGGGLCIHKK